MLSIDTSDVVMFDSLWDDAGYYSYVAPDTACDAGFTICTRNAARCIIWEMDGWVFVRQVMFGIQGGRLVDRHARFSKNEFATFLDLPRSEDTTETDLTAVEGSDVALWEKFSRRRQRVILTIGDMPTSFFITGNVWAHGARLLRKMELGAAIS